MSWRYTIIDRPGAHNHVAAWRGRCTYCGHRVGDNVIETRRQPWRIPAEIVGRYLAMRHLAMRHTDRINSPPISHEDDDYQTELLEETLT